MSCWSGRLFPRVKARTMGGRVLFVGSKGLMTVSLGLYLVGSVAGLVLAAVLRQPMLGVVWVGSCFVALVLSKGAGVTAWIVLAAKAALLGIVSITAPMLFGNDLIPVNPDQELYLTTAGHIAEALRRGPFGVDYTAIAGRHNRLYDVALGWLAFLNGSVSVLLFRAFNLFLSVVLCGLV